jgi:fructose-1,6-bisphosphatase II / sedoheptulose-1,7-bisphosphatase
LVFRNDEERGRATKIGIKDFDRIYSMTELAAGDVVFSATGVTDGWMVRGVHRIGSIIETQTIVMRSATGTVRIVDGKHDTARKPGLAKLAS